MLGLAAPKESVRTALGVPLGGGAWMSPLL